MSDLRGQLTCFTITNLPILQEDETLYSWAGAVHLSNPAPDVRETSRRLYGTPFAALLHDFPSHLGSLVGSLGGYLKSPRELALRHSLLGYFLPARPIQFATQILHATESGAVSSLKFRLGIAASRVGGHHPLKGCQKCFERQIKSQGRAYWIIDHQLPSVLCCVEHNETLQVAWDPITPVHRRGWLLPFYGLAREWHAYPPVSEIQFQRLKRLAEFSVLWAKQRPSSFDASRLSCVYRSALREHDLMTPGGSLRLAEIVRLVRQHYSGLEGFAELRAIRSSEASWSTLVGAASRRAPRPCHPLKHLLLISALFPSWLDLMTAYETTLIPTTEAVSKLVSLPVAPTSQQTFAELVKNQGLSISAAGRSAGITATTAVRWAKVLGLTFTPRAKTYTQDRLDAARAMLRRGETKVQVTAALNFSQGAVNRLISSEPDLAAAWRAAQHELARRATREKFSTILAQMRGRPLKEIRAVPGCGYSWLYRHDRLWLKENLPFFGEAAQ